MNALIALGEATASILIQKEKFPFQGGDCKATPYQDHEALGDFSHTLS